MSGSVTPSTSTRQGFKAAATETRPPWVADNSIRRANRVEASTRARGCYLEPQIPSSRCSDDLAECFHPRNVNPETERTGDNSPSEKWPRKRCCHGTRNSPLEWPPLFQKHMILCQRERPDVGVQCLSRYNITLHRILASAGETDHGCVVHIKGFEKRN
jgi:hypothetical protein